MLIRKAQVQDAPAIAQVHVASWQTAYKGIVAADYLATLDLKRREIMWRQSLTSTINPDFLYVAETAAGEIVGFAAAGPVRGQSKKYKGEIYAIYLLAEQQRQGIGRKLFNACVHQLQTEGITSLLIWVLADNPARRFYERLGGVYLGGKDKTIEIGQQQLVEVAYGWPDTAVINRS